MSQETRPFKNNNLFSNHYLETLLKESPEWKEAAPEVAFSRIKELYERKVCILENYNESQLSDRSLFARHAAQMGHPDQRSLLAAAFIRAGGPGGEDPLTFSVRIAHTRAPDLHRCIGAANEPLRIRPLIVYSSSRSLDL